MNILIVNEFYHPIQKGGAEVSVQLLAEEYQKLGHKVTVLTTSKKNEQDCINGINIFRINVNPFGWFGQSEPSNALQKIVWHTLDSYNFLASNKIKEIFDSVKPDIIHTNNLSHFSCILWKIAKRKNIPICHTIRDYYLLCPKRTLFNNHKCCDDLCFSCKLFSIPKKILSNRIDAVVGISDFILKRHLKEGFFQGTTEKKVIFNSTGTVESLNHKEKTYNIGFLGQVTEEKGIENLIKAFISCNNNKYSLQIAGKCDDNYLQNLKNIIGFNKSKINFIGKVNRDNFFKQIDTLVVPSIWKEPFGRIVIEAISADVPVIAAASGGITEILKNRKEGILYDSNDISSLKDVLNDFMNEKISFDFSQKEQFLIQFNQKNIATQYINLFNELILHKGTNND